MITIYKTKNYEELSRKTADIISAQLILKPHSVLGLATGSSPIGTYKELVRRCSEGTIDFSKVSTVNLDEYRGISGDNDQSYRYFMNTNLFDHVNIDKTKTNVPNGMAADPDAECARYDSVVSSMNGVDIQLLGIGHDGHIGFNEPCETFPKGTHVVKLTETTIKANSRLFASVDDVPREALTMGIGTIMAAKCLVLIASGKDKAEIVKKAFFGEVTPLVPASILQFHKNAILVADEDALSECNI